ncbi:MAG: carbohydrate-binding domain-containing protein [Oscillospiraceae bacterium]|nr:carbohydrate-binding domain-containing protein [Oscillospiraceae bacterium]
MKKIISLLLVLALCVSFAACASAADSNTRTGTTETAAAAAADAVADETETETVTREIRLSDADGSVTITEAGTYRLSGELSDGQIVVSAQDAQVTLILDGVDITAKGTAAIYVAEADKVKIELAEGSENSLRSVGAFSDPADDGIDAVIFARDDVTIKGTGALTVESEQGHGIVSKDDLKITGGTITVTAAKKGLCGNDSVEINGGTLRIQAGSDGVHCDTVVTVNGGVLDIRAAEGIEGTYVEINDGDITISATDDGINAARKSTDYEVAIVINGGKLSVTMGSGDTDALDSNGSITINGGTVDINAQFAFDFDTTGTLNGGTVTVNGTQVSSITNAMMGGGFGGRGGMGGFGGQGGGFGTPPSGGMGGFGNGQTGGGFGGRR